jgi:hypothetical protein
MLQMCACAHENVCIMLIKIDKIIFLKCSQYKLILKSMITCNAYRYIVVMKSMTLTRFNMPCSNLDIQILFFNGTWMFKLLLHRIILKTILA